MASNCNYVTVIAQAQNMCKGNSIVVVFPSHSWKGHLFGHVLLRNREGVKVGVHYIASIALCNLTCLFGTQSHLATYS